MCSGLPVLFGHTLATKSLYTSFHSSTGVVSTVPNGLVHIPDTSHKTLARTKNLPSTACPNYLLGSYSERVCMNFHD